MNQALSFGAIAAGGVFLISSITHTSLADVLKGKVGPVSHTGQNLGGATVSAGAAAAPAADTRSMAQVRDYLVSQGFTKTAASGIVGNLWQESSGNPNTPGGGLAQWIGSRWSDLTNFSTQHGLGPNTETAQLQFLVSDLRGPYSSLAGQLNAAATPGQAATLFSQQYERPGVPMLQNRINFANQAYGA